VTAAGKLAARLPVASDAQHPQRQQSARQKQLPGSWPRGCQSHRTRSTRSASNLLVRSSFPEAGSGAPAALFGIPR